MALVRFLKTATPAQAPSVWTNGQKFAFRAAFIFVVLWAIPLDYGWYLRLFALDYAHLSYQDFRATVSTYLPDFFEHLSEDGFFGARSYVNVVFTIFLGIVGSVIWGFFDRKRANYNTLYYWALVLARYRVAYGVIAWGYAKVFPLQMPPPSVGGLYTEYIHYFAKRLYWQVTGLSTPYVIILGFAEFIPAALLLFRRTAVLGAAGVIAVVGNVYVANLAYDVCEHIPSLGFTMLSAFILWYDFPRIWNLLVNNKDEQLVRYYPVFDKKWKLSLKRAVKYTGNGIFVFLFGIYHLIGWISNDKYKLPKTPGLPGAEGHYSVKEFRLNGETLPYSPLDSIRWHDVTFERFSSISILLANRPQHIAMFGPNYPRWGEAYDNQWYFHILGNERRYEGAIGRKGQPRKYDDESRDKRINWEFSGISERHWYFYRADTVNQILYLEHKNRRDNEFKQVLHYERPNSTTFILNGTNEFNDIIYVVLEKTPHLTTLEQALDKKL